MRALTIINIFLKPTNHISYAGKIYLNTVIVITGLLLILLKMAGIQVMDLLSKLVFMWQTLMVNWRPLTIQMTDDILCFYISLYCFPRLCFPFFLLCKHSHPLCKFYCFCAIEILQQNITFSLIVKVYRAQSLTDYRVHLHT